MWRPDICIHHAPCADGFTAAWAIWKRWPDIRFHPGVYGQEPPDVRGLDVLIVDFSYKLPVIRQMNADAASVTILDHHKSAQADLDLFTIDQLRDPALLHPGPTCTQALFDMDKSGAMLAWEYAHPGEPVPRLVQHVQDRDLWRFALDGTREISAEIFSHPYEFEVWNAFEAMCENDDLREVMIQSGQAIERKHHKDVAELLEMTTRHMVIGGYNVQVANLPYTMASDAANALAVADRFGFGACYFDDKDGNRVFSLRSGDEGVDVSEVAAAYGGGGHARAAGFRRPLGWEGER